MSLSPRSCLLIVDAQYDFLPGGSLAVPSGHEIIAPLVKLQAAFDLVVASQDWHPPSHRSFTVNRNPELESERANTVSNSWPVHCVQFSHGAEIVVEILRGKISRVIQKGTDIDVDSYSAFFDNDHRRGTGLHEYLLECRVRDVYICGLATDYCVKFTALDAVGLGFSTFVFIDACRGIDAQSTSAALLEMTKAGITLLVSDEFLVR